MDEYQIKATSGTRLYMVQRRQELGTAPGLTIWCLGPSNDS